MLIRVRKPDGSVTGPALLLEAAERFHLIWKVDKYVLQHTFTYLNEFAKEEECLSVNLSGQTLCSKVFMNFCRELFKQAKFDLSRLGFEITETDIIKNFDEAKNMLSFLQSFGCKVSLDDFGSGMSSYAYITKLNLHTIKIDGVFIQNIDQRRENQSIVKSIVQLCSDLSMSTVAEFVETEKELSTLTSLGLDYVQGYLVHKPELFYDPLNHEILPAELKY